MINVESHAIGSRAILEVTSFAIGTLHLCNNLAITAWTKSYSNPCDNHFITILSFPNSTTNLSGGQSLGILQSRLPMALFGSGPNNTSGDVIIRCCSPPTWKRSVVGSWPYSVTWVVEADLERVTVCVDLRESESMS